MSSTPLIDWFRDLMARSVLSRFTNCFCWGSKNKLVENVPKKCLDNECIKSLPSSSSTLLQHAIRQEKSIRQNKGIWVEELIACHHFCIVSYSLSLSLSDTHTISLSLSLSCFLFLTFSQYQSIFYVIFRLFDTAYYYNQRNTATINNERTQ